MSDNQWIPVVGERVRVLREIEKRYREDTYTVRCAPQPSHLHRDRRPLVRVDDGDPLNDDIMTNGSGILSWVAVSSIEPWTGPPRPSRTAGYAAECRRLRARVAELEAAAAAHAAPRVDGEE